MGHLANAVRALLFFVLLESHSLQYHYWFMALRLLCFTLVNSVVSIMFVHCSAVVFFFSDQKHPDVQAAIYEACERMKKLGKPIGMLTGDMNDAVRLFFYNSHN
jgi:cation transport ATPase